MTAISTVQPQVKISSQMVLRFAIGVALSALSGVMLLLAFPPYGIWPLAWVALIPALFAQYRLLPQRLSSLASSLYILFWLGPFFARYFENLFGPFFTYLGVLIALLGLFLSIERKFHELTGFRWFVIYGMFNWVGIEMIRATFIPHIGIGAFIGLTQATQAWLFQPVSFFSIYGFNFVILLVNYALALGVLAWYDRKYPFTTVRVDTRLSKRWLAVTGSILVVWIGLSLVLLSSTPKDSPTVRVAALRPGYVLPAFNDEVNTRQVRLEAFASQARQAAAQGAQVLVTPEMMFDFDPRQQFTEEFKAIARETNTYIFIAYAVVDPLPFRNEIILLSPSGEFSEAYAKNHPMPGEPLSPDAGRFPVFDTPFGKMAAMICHDVDFMDVARKLAANGAQLIALGLWEYRGAAEQQWTNATFNAVQSNTAIVVTGTTYFSAIIDQKGHQVELDIRREPSPLVMVGDVVMGSGHTIYSAIGDVLGWFALVGLAFFTTFMFVIRLRAWKAARK